MSVWTSVKDRLPDHLSYDGQRAADVLAVEAETGDMHVATLWWNAAGGHTWNSDSGKIDVTHWQPLPDPPSTVDLDKNEGA